MLDGELEFLSPCFNLGLAQRPSPRRFAERRFRFLQGLIRHILREHHKRREGRGSEAVATDRGGRMGG